MTITDFLTAVNKHRPELPPTDVLDTVQYRHNGLDDWDGSDDMNGSFRESVAAALFKDYSQDHKAIIRLLLSAEIQHCREETMMTDVLRRLTFMLYDLGDVADIPLLYEAKEDTSFDAMCALDAELIIGKEPEKVKQHYLEHPHPVYNIIGFITERESGVEDPAAFISGMRKYYAD